MKKALLFLFLAVVAGAIAAETLTLQPSADVYNYFPAASIDPSDPGSQPIIFTAAFTGLNASTSYRLYVNLQWNATMLLEDGHVDGTPLFCSVPGRNLTSRDIIAEENDYFTSGSFDFQTLLDNSQEFEDAIMNTGRFPDGQYTVTVRLIDRTTNDQLAEGGMSFNIISPVSIQLLYPGTQMGGQVMPYLDIFPNFIWMSNLTDYHFLLWELTGAGNMSAEDVENMSPYFEVENIGVSSFTYPPDAPSLEVGGVYAWQVRAGLTNPGGSGENIKSPVFIFRVANPDENQIYEQILANYLNNLHVEGLDQVYELLSQGYTPTGTITFMGQEMSFEELQALLIKVLNGEIEVSSIIIQ